MMILIFALLVNVVGMPKWFIKNYIYSILAVDKSTPANKKISPGLIICLLICWINGLWNSKNSNRLQVCSNVLRVWWPCINQTECPERERQPSLSCSYGVITNFLDLLSFKR
ncbi:hypothetical protein F5884DRAFT_784680 [Xylogone sp. PMI_703]|nr:hypothetical protein F5884DRAFT_784680 [Xylogone sp. PMI_703]